MTLTELKYVLAVAKERHFGRAAEACFVSQPTLSVAIKKLEDELNVTLFERGSEVGVTPIGEKIIEQAQKVLQECQQIKNIAQKGQNPLSGALRVGTIYTVGPYLLPRIIPKQLVAYPDMPLILQENYTVTLLDLLKQGELDCAILALPIPTQGLSILPLYTEKFMVAVPAKHPLAKRKAIPMTALKNETMLLLGQGHCFRDQVLEVCPEQTPFAMQQEGIQKTLEGSSLETIRHMVAAGLGITLLPVSAVLEQYVDEHLVKYIPIQSEKETVAPSREVVMVWRSSFSRPEAVHALANVIKQANIPGVNVHT